MVGVGDKDSRSHGEIDYTTSAKKMKEDAPVPSRENVSDTSDTCQSESNKTTRCIM